jgi:hypothetical protein
MSGMSLEVSFRLIVSVTELFFKLTGEFRSN